MLIVVGWLLWVGSIHTQQTTHNVLSLLLLVFCIRADDPHDAFPPDAASNFHDLSSSFHRNGPVTAESGSIVLNQ
jgi:hypothetical protein